MTLRRQQATALNSRFLVQTALLAESPASLTAKRPKRRSNPASRHNFRAFPHNGTRCASLFQRTQFSLRYDPDNSVLAALMDPGCLIIQLSAIGTTLRGEIIVHARTWREIMARKFLFGSAALAALLFAWRGEIASAQAPPAPPQPQQAATAPADQQQLPEPEVLDKGPIHEAFAEPMSLGQQEMEIITKQPPQPVNELPPNEQPEGQNVEWIPGYWMFDKLRDDFVWVSGMWRDVPPGRNWVPGEWQQVDNGWQWVPGFWADGKQQQVQMLPLPPESLEAGPSSPAPGDNYLWAPGNWAWQNNEYVWQPGYWYEANDNYVWVPNHYTYTPRGSIFVNGYWDYLPYNRGLLYAPVYWGAGYGGGFYRPRSILNTALLISSLFVNRGYGHYYYGNWGNNYPGWLQPWGYNYGPWGYRSGNYFGYDPMWSYFRWSNRNNWDNDWWRDRNNWDRGRDNWRNDWDRWSWDGRRRDRDWDGDWDGDRDGRPGDRDGDRDGRGPRDRDDDIAGGPDGRGDRDGRGPRDNDLITTVDNITRDGRNAIRTRDLSEADINRIRDRAENLRGSRRDIVAGSEGAIGLDGRVTGDRQGRGRGRIDGQVGAGVEGQVRGEGRGRGQIDGSARTRGDVQIGDDNIGIGADGRVRSDGQLSGEGRGRGQLDGNARTRGDVQVGDNNVGVDAGVRTDSQLQRGRPSGADLNNQTDARARLDAQTRGRTRGSVDGSVNQELRGQQNRTLDGRSYTRGQQGIQYGDRPQGQGQIPGNVQRNLEGPTQQRVMRLPSGQEVMPQGQNYRSRGEGSRPQGNYNRGGQGQRSFNVPQGGGNVQRSIQQAPQNIQRSLPGGGGGGGGNRGGGGGGRGRGDR
jgi:hypothetical protein